MKIDKINPDILEFASRDNTQAGIYSEQYEPSLTNKLKKKLSLQ